ncbi:MAG: DUF3141 domain-containing protein [Pseudomonadota bacterium]
MQIPAVVVTDLFFSYLLDAYQRTIIFLDVLRQRGDEQEAITHRPLATVFAFKYEILLNGKTFSRPVNYYLGRILATDNQQFKLNKAPVIVVDPRAGQGPGISGFKAKSEIGMALKEGHPVYFIAFSANPLGQQTFLDVIDGQVTFIQHVVNLHPDSPRPIVIGNCQAGYQTFMAAMLRPDLFGSVIMAGSPMSFWQGVHAKNPLRYSGGLAGGSWLTAFTSDLGNGKFDGANLIANFDNLNPANFFWSKQYQVYANIDDEPKRYLGFEKWWGDFVYLNATEIQYLVDNLFIGNKLCANELVSNDGHVFDLRSVNSPVICFTSMADHISPPQQTLGWILDVYRSEEEIKQRGRTIIYCVDADVGHLAIFVSAKVAVKEDAAFVRTIDILESLPPGLYEMIIQRKNPEKYPKDFSRSDFIASFQRRSLNDIKAFGRNSVADDKAFATVKRLSEINLSRYRTYIQPVVKFIMNDALAQMLRVLHPIRLSYTLFASTNLCMAPIKLFAEEMRLKREKIPFDNFFLQVQNAFAKQVEDFLEIYRVLRDSLSEAFFFMVYGSQLFQGYVGTNSAGNLSRQPPALSPAEEKAFKTTSVKAMAKLKVGNFDEAIIRALLYVLSAEKCFDERTAEALYQFAQQRLHLQPKAIKKIVAQQALILDVNPKQAIEYLSIIVPKADDRKELLQLIKRIISNTDAKEIEIENRINHLAKILTKKT